MRTVGWILLLPWLGNAALVANHPQMGWNTWNYYKANINQTVIYETADLLVSTGLRDAGYTYLILDDGWQAKTRDSIGRQQFNTTKFPDGVTSLAEYLHKRGLKFGIYSDAGIFDCAFYPGSWGYEELDAVTYAEWGVDYLKYDNCGGFIADNESPGTRFSIMRDALLKSGRDIFYSMCQWGNQFPWYWADQIGHSYRMSGDITSIFTDTGTDCSCKTAYCLNTGYAGCSVLTVIRKMRELSPFQKLGSWLDMDMLEIGIANMTLSEQQTHMSFWAALKSPLIIGAPLSNLSAETISILKNKEIISISQDPLGTAVKYIESLSVDKKYQVWAGELSRGRIIILALNEQNSTTNLNLLFSQVPSLTSGTSYSVRDLWNDRSIGRFSTSLNVTVGFHETKVLILST